jgi:GT2 family glycosyltransferase
MAGTPLDDCLASLDAQTFRNFSVIVVDNGGRVTDAMKAQRHVLVPGRNLGFGAAVNLAASKTEAQWIAVLNDDAVASPQWLEEMSKAISGIANIDSAKLGMLASRIILSGDRDGELDSAGLLFCADGSSKQRGHGGDPAKYPNPEEALFPSGAAGLYRRELWDQTGGYDEAFFLYCEDSDLGLRAQWLGWRCAYVPAAVVYHRYSESAGRVSPLKAYLVERNRLFLAVKNLPATMLWKAPLIAVERYWWHLMLPKGSAAAFREAQGSWRLAWYVLKTHFALLPNLGRLLSQRSSIRRGAKIAPDQFQSQIRRFSISPREVASQ